MKILDRFMRSPLSACCLLLAFSAPAWAGVVSTTYYHNDILGSPVAATDQGGDLLWREQYKPYGERILNEPEAAENSRWYTGHPHDPETGLTYAGARYYDPVVGRFMSVDPVGFLESNPTSFNRYAYANNNPYKYVDPDGEVPILVWVVVLGLEAANLALEAGAEPPEGCGNDCIVSSGAFIPGPVAKVGATKILASAGDDIAKTTTRLTNEKFDDLWGKTAEGAREALSKLKAGQLDIPNDLTRQELLWYRERAVAAMEKQKIRAMEEQTEKFLRRSSNTDEVQGARVEIIDILLERHQDFPL